MNILSPEQIKNPSGSLVHEEPKTTDWVKDHADPILGANVQRTVLQADRDWTPFVTEIELQRNAIFDPFDCVTQSAWNQIQCLAKRLYGVTLNLSKRYTAVKSGTKPHVGNSVSNVVECIRLKGGVPEVSYVTITPTMTEVEFFQAIDASIDALEGFLSEGWSYLHEWLPQGFLGATMSSIIDDGLLYSPVMVSVEGQYIFDDQDCLKFSGRPYMHEVLAVKSQPDCFLAVDSENPTGLIKIRRDYAFVGPKIGYLSQQKKTALPIAPFIKVGNAIAYLAQSGMYAGKYVGCGDSDTMLSVWGNYMKNQRQELADWPANYSGHSLFIK